jgi:hypothetical protein
MFVLLFRFVFGGAINTGDAPGDLRAAVRESVPAGVSAALLSSGRCSTAT